MHIFHRSRAATVLCVACLYLPFRNGQISSIPAQPFSLKMTSQQFARLLAAPPRDGSRAAAADLAEVHRAEQLRSPADIQAAQFDDTHEDLFIYGDVLGPSLTAERLPRTAALSARIRKTGGSIDNPLKAEFHKLRPYNFDSTLHPVCETNKEYSYPSGHAVNGYLYAFTLAEMLPEKRDAILSRADRYAHNRIVCGVHYPADVEASRRIAMAAFGALLANPEFVEAFHTAEAETRAALHRAPVRSSPSGL